MITAENVISGVEAELVSEALAVKEASKSELEAGTPAALAAQLRRKRRMIDGGFRQGLLATYAQAQTKKMFFEYRRPGYPGFDFSQALGKMTVEAGLSESDYQKVAVAMTELAESKGWKKVYLTGEDTFQVAIARESARAGIELGGASKAAKEAWLDEMRQQLESFSDAPAGDVPVADIPAVNTPAGDAPIDAREARRQAAAAAKKGVFLAIDAAATSAAQREKPVDKPKIGGIPARNIAPSPR